MDNLKNSAIARYPPVFSAVGVLLSGCSDEPAGIPRVAAPERTAGIVSTWHVCRPRSGGRYGVPPPSLTVTSDGHPRNDWTVPVGSHGLQVPVTVTEIPGTQIARIWFVIARAKYPFPGAEIRTLPTAAENWGPGEHTTTAFWDGKDDHGRTVKPGTYQLRAAATVTTTNHVVICTDRTRGVEKLSASGEIAALGSIVVRHRNR